MIIQQKWESYVRKGLILSQSTAVVSGPCTLKYSWQIKNHTTTKNIQVAFVLLGAYTLYTTLNQGGGQNGK